MIATRKPGMTLRGRVYLFIHKESQLKVFGEPRGATRHEIVVALALRHQSVTARVCELIKEGHVFESDRFRATDTGRMARVLVASKVLAPESGGGS